MITLIVAALSAVVAWKIKPEELPASAPPVLSVQEMGTLTTLRVNYSNVIEFNQQLTQGIPWVNWQFSLGGTRVLLIARGECLLGTDLNLAKYEQTVQVSKTATLSLPIPKVLSARLNHDPKAGGSYFYQVDTNGITALMPGTARQTNAMNQALQKGQGDIEAACGAPELLAAAKRSAESVLRPVVSATGWKIRIAWR
ncbi:DUF4230 domain-containing protein [Aquabacterium sp.]|uniref:DUF4230 domain-containing protein n=1 Tax=Aquabacterium sp. TaxID=1872578 RepID=UPI003783B4DA